MDMTTLEDVLIIGPKYGDHRTEWGKTRDECRRVTVCAAILQESWDEVVHNNVPLDRGGEESELGGSSCYATAEDQPEKSLPCRKLRQQNPLFCPLQ